MTICVNNKIACSLIDGNSAANDDSVYELSKDVVRNWFNDGRYCRIGTIGDGSCFFHSVCKALNVKKYRDLEGPQRRALIKQFRRGLSDSFNEGHYTEINGSLVGSNKRTFEQMKQALGQVPTWADEAMIRYVSGKLGCNIVFLNFGDNANKMYCGVHQANTLQAVAQCGRPKSPTIIVAWVDHSHFELVGRIDEVGPEKAMIRVVFDPADARDQETIQNVMRAYAVKCKGVEV